MLNNEEINEAATRAAEMMRMMGAPEHIINEEEIRDHMIEFQDKLILDPEKAMEDMLNEMKVMFGAVQEAIRHLPENN